MKDSFMIEELSFSAQPILVSCKNTNISTFINGGPETKTIRVFPFELCVINLPEETFKQTVYQFAILKIIYNIFRSVFETINNYIIFNHRDIAVNV